MSPNDPLQRIIEICKEAGWMVVVDGENEFVDGLVIGTQKFTDRFIPVFTTFTRYRPPSE